MTAYSPEEFVRGAWEHLGGRFANFDSPRGYGFGVPMSWEKAYDVCLSRIEEIRLRREEIELMQEAFINNERDRQYPDDAKIAIRILQRLQSAEADLLTGMNKDFVDKYLAEQAKGER